MEKPESTQYHTHISSHKKRFELNLKEVWRYRDLILLFTKRSFVLTYKQTILGPAWIFLTPLFSSIVQAFVFGGIAGIATDGVPMMLFYLCGNAVWAFFSSCLTQNASTFTANAYVFGKVYFPRLVMPISTVMSNLISLAIQFMFMIIFLVFYTVTDQGCHPNLYILMTPLIILQLALLSLGCGIIISALTTKYRDLAMAVGFGLNLWQYATPVAYGFGLILANAPKYAGLYSLNPVTPAVLSFRYGVFGVGYFDTVYYIVGWGVTLLVAFLGLLLFNRIEKNFADTV